MHISTLLFTLLAATTIAQTDFCAGNKEIVGYCETISYIDRTLNATDPPSASDCQDACRGVLTDAGDWGVTFTGYPVNYRQNMVGSLCGFSMGRAPGQPLDYSFSMDNQDIVDIFDEVTKRFAPLHGGKVAAEGLIRCQGFEATWYIN